MKFIINLNNSIFNALQPILEPLFLLLMRVGVFWPFFNSGMTKINSWDSTIYLFSEEYKVPLLSPHMAAIMGTGVELILPVLLVIGLFTRTFAGILFLFNIIAVISYPILLKDGFSLFLYGTLDHQLWGVMLLSLVVFGAGKISLDHLLKVR